VEKIPFAKESRSDDMGHCSLLHLILDESQHKFDLLSGRDILDLFRPAQCRSDLYSYENC
jgi:hypothetical protein